MNGQGEKVSLNDTATVFYVPSLTQLIVIDVKSLFFFQYLMAHDLGMHRILEGEKEITLTE